MRYASSPFVSGFACLFELFLHNELLGNKVTMHKITPDTRSIYFLCVFPCRQTLASCGIGVVSMRKILKIILSFHSSFLLNLKQFGINVMQFNYVHYS